MFVCYHSFPRRLTVHINFWKRIDNPLQDQLPAQLDRQALLFANRANADPTLFKKAARLAQDPLDWLTVKELFGLTPQEERALERESSIGFWHQAKDLKVTVATLCFSAIIQGWVQSAGNGSNASWPCEFGLCVPENEMRNNVPPWRDVRSLGIFASVNAVTFLAASIFGCWLSDPLQSLVIRDKAILGRRGAIFASCCLCLAGLVGSACSHTWKQLMGCRAVLGLGIGSKASITPIFGAEVAPSHLRGTLVMNWQLFDAFGIFLGFTANLILYRIGPLSWRFSVASALLPVICLLTLAWVIPESPRWLLKQGRLEEAFQAMCALRETPLQAAREVFYANAQLQAEASLVRKREKDEEESPQPETRHVEDVGNVRRRRTNTRDQAAADAAKLNKFRDEVKKSNYWSRFWQLFSNRRTRRATVAAAVVMISQQLCGVNVLAFYSTTFFNDTTSEKSRFRAVWMSWGVGLANVIFTFPAYYFIERGPNWRPGGRRFLLLSTYPWMTLFMLAACLSFLLGPGTARFSLVGLFLFLFLAAYALGQGPVPFAYSSEVFPLINREVGMSFAVFVNFFGAGLLTLFVPLAQLPSGKGLDSGEFDSKQRILLACFVVLNVLAFVLIYLLVPETAIAVIPRQAGQLISISLEELNWIFGVSTRQHIHYQCSVMLYWYLGMARWLAWGWMRGHPVPQAPDNSYDWATEKAAAVITQRELGTLTNDEAPAQRQVLGFSDIVEMSRLQTNEP